jgi:hypothetical protein
MKRVKQVFCRQSEDGDVIESWDIANETESIP